MASSSSDSNTRHRYDDHHDDDDQHKNHNSNKDMKDISIDDETNVDETMPTTTSNSNSPMIPSRLMFGSCRSQHYTLQEQEMIWKRILQRHPTAFVWGGDAVYADDRILWDDRGRKHKLPATPDYLHQLYQDLLHQEPSSSTSTSTSTSNVHVKITYKSLLDLNVSIFGTLDDHDYGINNGDSTYAYKRQSGVEFVQFLQLPKYSAMYQRAEKGKGVYGVQVYDFSSDDGRGVLLTEEQAGLDPDVVPEPSTPNNNSNSNDKKKNRLVAIFVLDIRTNKKPWNKKFPHRLFTPDWDGDFLGLEQWKWLETALSRSNAAVNIIVSGLQVHAERFYDGSFIENWSGFPKAQEKLYQVILQPNVQAPIIISGDVHHAQLLRKDCRLRNKHNNNQEQQEQQQYSFRPLYEVTTSGMTHSLGSTIFGRKHNTHPVARFPPIKAFFRPLVNFAFGMCPWKEMILDDNDNDTHRQQGRQLQYTLEKNVAELELDWEQEMVKVRIWGEANDNDNDDENHSIPLLEQHWTFQDLTALRQQPQDTASATTTATRVPSEDFDMAEKRFRHGITTSTMIPPKGHVYNTNDDPQQWVCVPYRGLIGRVEFALGVLSVGAFVGFIWVLLPLLFLVLLIIRVRSAVRSRNAARRHHGRGQTVHEKIQ